MKAKQHSAINRLICYYYKSGKLGKRFTFCTLLVGGPAPNPP